MYIFIAEATVFVLLAEIQHYFETIFAAVLLQLVNTS